MSKAIAKYLLVLILLAPSICYADMNAYQFGRYVITTSSGDGHETYLVDSLTGKTWILTYISSKDGKESGAVWHPIGFPGTDDKYYYLPNN